jgi:hypothetical protein
VARARVQVRKSSGRTRTGPDPGQSTRLSIYFSSRYVSTSRSCSRTPRVPDPNRAAEVLVVPALVPSCRLTRPLSVFRTRPGSQELVQENSFASYWSYPRTFLMPMNDNSIKKWCIRSRPGRTHLRPLQRLLSCIGQASCSNECPLDHSQTMSC